MGLTLTEKIIKAHIIDGEMVKGTEIGLKIDQTLTQDATGTMAYLQFEAMGVDRVKTERSVAYYIAGMMGCSVSTAKSRFRLGISQLKRMMEEDEDER